MQTKLHIQDLFIQGIAREPKLAVFEKKKKKAEKDESSF